jgi:hypothetical protein
MVSNNIDLKKLYDQWFVIRFKIFVLDYEKNYIILFHNSNRNFKKRNHSICDYIQLNAVSN